MIMHLLSEACAVGVSLTIHLGAAMVARRMTKTGV